MGGDLLHPDPHHIVHRHTKPDLLDNAGCSGLKHHRRSIIGDLFAADVPLDAGGGEQLVVASEGATIHAAWLEAGTLVHQRSLDAGATWSVAQPLSLGEVPTEVQLSVLGDQLVASWIGDGATVRAASSADGGVTFDPAVTLNVWHSETDLLALLAF